MVHVNVVISSGIRELRQLKHLKALPQKLKLCSDRISMMLGNNRTLNKRLNAQTSAFRFLKGSSRAAIDPRCDSLLRRRLPG